MKIKISKTLNPHALPVRMLLYSDEKSIPFSWGNWTIVKWFGIATKGYDFYQSTLHMTSLSLTVFLSRIQYTYRWKKHAHLVLWRWENRLVQLHTILRKWEEEKKTTQRKTDTAFLRLMLWFFHPVWLSMSPPLPFSVACFLHRQRNITLDPTLAMYYHAVPLV